MKELAVGLLVLWVALWMKSYVERERSYRAPFAEEELGDSHLEGCGDCVSE